VLVFAAVDRAGALDSETDTILSEGYTDGYTFQGTGLWIGGDATIEASVPEDTHSTVTLDELSLLLRWEPTPRLAFFTETKLDNLVTFTDSEGVSGGSRVLSIERLYLDWAATPTLTVRAGKFLTPFGLWNVIRRTPLSWTVERPLVTERFFPEHTTGLQLLYQTTWRGWSLDATAYGPAQEELALHGGAQEEDGRVVGGRLAIAHTLGPAFIGIGFNGAGIDPHSRGRWHGVTGTDLEVTAFGNFLTSEFTFEPPTDRQSDLKWGFYIQDAFPLIRRLYGVVRYERFDGQTGLHLDAELIGLAWRPVPFLILKADYQFANRSLGDFQRGFLASLTLFF
jgi:hypothetical protein